jgi:hypothetical protein
MQPNEKTIVERFINGEKDLYKKFLLIKPDDSVHGKYLKAFISDDGNNDYEKRSRCYHVQTGEKTQTEFHSKKDKKLISQKISTNMIIQL